MVSIYVYTQSIDLLCKCPSLDTATSGSLDNTRFLGTDFYYRWIISFLKRIVLTKLIQTWPQQMNRFGIAIFAILVVGIFLTLTSSSCRPQPIYSENLPHSTVSRYGIRHILGIVYESISYPDYRSYCVVEFVNRCSAGAGDQCGGYWNRLRSFWPHPAGSHRPNENPHYREVASSQLCSILLFL